MCVRRLEPLSELQFNFLGFSTLNMNTCLQATFDSVGKGQQRKRYDKPRHRQPESAARGTTAILQARRYHRRSTSYSDLFESDETSLMIGYVKDTGSNWIFIKVRPELRLSLDKDKRVYGQ